MLFGSAMSMTKTKTIRSSFQSLGNPWQLISHNLPNNTSCKLYSLKNFERPNQDCPHNRQQAAKTINLHKYCQKPVQTNIEPTGSNRHTACKHRHRRNVTSHHFTSLLFTSFHFYVYSNFFDSHQLKSEYNTHTHIQQLSISLHFSSLLTLTSIINWKAKAIQIY